MAIFAAEHCDFEPEFPEEWNWNHLFSITLTDSAQAITSCILRDFQTTGRTLVPGLRKALNIIAEIGECE